MSKILAYRRTSTDKQDLNNQKLEILESARQNDLRIEDFIAILKVGTKCGFGPLKRRNL